MKSRLKDIIEERGLKQNYVSKKTGISPATLSLIVNGKTLPTLPTAYRIAKALDLRIEDIWYEE